jgi:hypothetical protein
MPRDEGSSLPAFSWLGPLREPLRRLSLSYLDKLLATGEGRRILFTALHGQTGNAVTPAGVRHYAADRVYADLGLPGAASSAGAAPVFVTARFRSGSTLVWNLFRHVEGCTSYYEPLNERRWFDPATRGDRIDRTHLGAEEYWREYAGLGQLGRYYDVRWIDHHLYMGPEFHAPALRAYIQALVEAAPERAVLQFNRVDFRLPWLRKQFPDARVIHLFRHPRDQWCSSLVDPALVPRGISVRDFAAKDEFYLIGWARDLSYVFPMLNPEEAEHPYDLFYLIWKLSYAFGRAYADLSVSFEQLAERPRAEIPRLMAAAGIDTYDLERLAGIVSPQSPGKWRQWADQEWFARREARCEEMLDGYFRPMRLPVQGSTDAS